MIGIPPATDASYSRLTLFFSAKAASWSPYFAINALFAVITCFLFLRAEKTNFFATPSDPPINSTIMSTSSIKDKFKGLLIHFDFGILINLFLFIFLAQIYLIRGIFPVLMDILILFFSKNL